MFENRKLITKQVLAWTTVFALLLSTLPYSAADQTSDEYFESWSYELSDTDGDDQYDTIFFTFDPNTNVSDYVDVEVDMTVRDSSGNYVGGDEEDYEIYWTEEDSFEMEWFVDDCDDWDSDCEGPFNFEFYLYENLSGYSYLEDNFTESNISLYETTIAPEGIIQIENGVFSDDDDGYHNDIAFLSHMKDYEISNVTIELERKVGTQWVDVGSDETNEEGELFFKNMTSGEYRWFATYEGDSIDAQSHTFVFYSATSDENIGHVGLMGDFDGDDDFDDFAFYRLIDNGSGDGWNVSDGVYVELFHAENNTLYTEDGGDGDNEVLMFNNVPEGNYTFNMYNESSDGDLLQSGWMHSYGSLSTDSDENEYFDSIEHNIYDEDGDGDNDTIDFDFDIDTTCDCYVNVTFEFNVYDNLTGEWIDEDELNYTVYHDDNDEEYHVWTPWYNGTFDFSIELFDDEGNLEDQRNYFDISLQARGNSSDVESNEYFDSADFELTDNDNNGEDDTIVIVYDPDTDCNCTTNVTVYLDIYNVDNGNETYVGYQMFYHQINGTDIDNFETYPWSPYENGNYTFKLELYDDNWNYEDNINFTVYLGCNTNNGSQYCNHDEWFEYWDHVTEDGDEDNLDDTIVVDFDPNTECDCELDVQIYISVYYNSSGNFAGNDYDVFSINGTQIDYFEMEWTSSNSSSYDFYVYMYDEVWNLEDSFWIYDVYLYQSSDAGGPGDEDEYFDYFYHYTYDADDDGSNDTIEFVYDPDTTCDCYVNITTHFDFYDNQTGNFVDSFDVEDQIYGDDNDYFYDEWSPTYNGTFDIIIRLFDDGEYLEDEKRFDNIQLNIRSESNQSGDDANEWFGDVDFRVDRDLLEMGFNPNTEFEGYTNVSVQINIYDEDGNEMLEDTISALIYSDDYDWIEYNWTAYESGYYYFELRLFDENNNFEDEYYSDDIFLKGNESDNQAWFESLTYTVTDADGDEENDKVFLDYTIKAECENEMQLLLILDVFDQDLVMIDTFEEYFILQNNEILELSFNWENNYSEEEITFFSVLEYLVDGDTDGEIIVQDSSNISFYLDVFDYGAEFFVEDVTGRENVFEGQNIELEILLSGTNDVVVDWFMGDGTSYQNTFDVNHVYYQSGHYDITIHAYDEYTFIEENFKISVRNIDPIILNVMMDDIVNEGDQVSFNVQYEDVPMDMANISVKWVFPDEVFYGNFVQYDFVDDGEFLISVEVKDGDGGLTMQQRMVTVQNVAPVFTEFSLPSGGEQGVAMKFYVSATDPGDDTVTYRFDFGDGTAQLITQDGNVSHKFASADTFEIIICAIDEDGGETCRTDVIPVTLLEQLEESGLPGFGFLGVISALGVITLLRRRTH